MPIIASSRHQIPTVLVTTAFEPDEGNTLVAADDVGSFLVRSPVAVHYHVELQIDPKRLNAVLDRLGFVEAWVHLGHGRGQNGLWVPAEGEVSAGRWAKCFRNRGLRLAVFLSCNSHHVAQHFAEHGTGVAIGFEGEVRMNARAVASKVLEVMLNAPGRNATILEGFLSGDAAYEAEAAMEIAKPRAYH